MGTNAQALFMIGYNAFASQFDGANDWLSKAEDFTGNANGTTGLMSFWYRLDAETVNGAYIYVGPNVTFGPRVSTMLATYGSNKLVLETFTAAGASKVRLTSGSNIAPAVAWHHVIMSWDSADASKCKMYLDGADDSPTVSQVAGTISYTGTDHTIGAAVGGGTNKYNGCLAELWYAPNQWIDLTVASNRQKFRTTGGRPAYLGNDGSSPTGTAPVYYMKGKASTIATNYGSGGNMTINGAFEDASTNP